MTGLQKKMAERGITHKDEWPMQRQQDLSQLHVMASNNLLEI